MNTTHSSTWRKLTALFVIMAMVFTSLGLSTVSVNAAAKAPTKLSLKATAKTVDIKGTVKVSVKSVSPAKASKSVTWQSSDKKTATVSQKGIVTGKKSGKVKITAVSKKNKKVKASVTITVKNLKPKVSLSASKLSLEPGQSKVLKASVGPKGVYNKGIAWKSSNTKVAAVSSKGTVKAKAAGKAVITAYSKESGKYKATCSVTVKDMSIHSQKGNPNEYVVTSAVRTYKAAKGQPYIATVGDWRKANNKGKTSTYFVNGEALSDDDLIISNGKIGLVLAVGTRNPWGYPAGSVLDAGYFKGGKPARDTIWSLEFLMNGWDSWAPENCGKVTFDLVNYDFTACKEVKTGLPAVKVSRDYTVLKDADGKACDIDVITYYSMEAGADYAYMYDTVINNGKAAVTGKTTRFALTNKGDDGGALKYLKDERAVMSYGNKDGQEYGICYTVPKTQSDSKVDVNGKGGSLGYKELRGTCSYDANSTTVYQEYITISDKADTAKLTNFLNKKNSEQTMTVKGTVTDDANAAVADAVIAVKKEGTLFGFYKADAKGAFIIDLPTAVYEMYVEKDGYAKGEAVSVSGSKDIDLKAGALKQELTINLRDQKGNKIWGKAEILGEYPEVRYTGDSVFQAQEKGVIHAKVSDMDNFKATVYGQGYFFYSDTVDITNADAKDGAVTVTVDQKIKKPEGWLSSDMHHHANKNDGFADPKDAIPSHLASALDVSFITDHDFTVNNKEAYDLITGKYKGQMAGFVPSEEISCSWAHFNVLPQTLASYDFFLDANKENHVMDQFSKFPAFVKQTHDKDATITANHPWYSYGLFYTEKYGANGVPGGYEDSYDNIEINACSSDFENANTIISACQLWTAYQNGTDYLGAKVEKPHYMVGGSDTHDVLIPGVTNKGGDYTATNYEGFARGESEHYNSGKVRTFAYVNDTNGTVKDVGLKFTKAAAEGASYISFGPVLTLDQKPGDMEAKIENGTFTLNMKVDSLAAITDVLVLTKDAKDNYTAGTLNGEPNPGYSSPYQDQTYIKYDKALSPAVSADGNYTISVPVESGHDTWAAVLVMDENGNYAMTNPYWLSAK
ncbi:MAG: CehA/McbA family metallohydrolase [Firmicutes bacterium]|nr:CehA/McbA family metallohydrolase [Bacillota bacterium]